MTWNDLYYKAEFFLIKVTKGLNHRQFRLLLNETERMFSDLLLYNKVC